MPCIIGSDESGKGDYFGYLVVAAVCADEKTAKQLEKIGVQDSKNLADERIKILAKAIEKSCKFSIVKISPEKYNILYKKLENMNKILAWAHATAIENVLKECKKCETVIIDKFSDDSGINKLLEKKGIKIKIIEKTKAESEMVVAAASILARAEFVRTLRQLSYELGYKLPKGSTHVKGAMKYIKENYEHNVLSKIAKTHFKIKS